MKRLSIASFVALAMACGLMVGCASSSLPTTSSETSTTSASSEPSTSVSSSIPSSEIFVTKLATPVVTIQASDTVAWVAVAFAASYVVEVDDVEYPVNVNSFSVAEYGTYLIRVKAISGDTNVYLHSDYSDIVTLNHVDPRFPLEAPIIDKLNATTVYWLPVDDAASYQVYFDGVAHGQPMTTFNFSIADLDFGTYPITVTALPSDQLTYKASPASNQIVLEKIDPATYKDRLSLDIVGNRNLFLGDGHTYTVTLSDLNSADISNLSSAVTWSIETGDAATINSTTGQLSTLSAGEVVIKAVLNLEENVFVTKQITILQRPSISVSIALYDKVNLSSNLMNVTSSYDGTLYYVSLDNEPASANTILQHAQVKQVAITAGSSQVLMDIGTPRGEDINVYFVLVCTLNDEVVGNSNIFDIIQLPMNAVKTHVTNYVELQTALIANAEYVVLDNDINVAGSWARIDTTFTGTLDGNNHKLYNLNLTGGGTGIFKTLGHRAVIKNITFDSVTALGFDGASNAILSSKLAKNSRVIIRNVDFSNIYMRASVEGSSRSTAACLFGEYNYSDDTSLEVIIDNTFINYRYEITRTTQTYNIGTIFGTFVSTSSKALTLNNVFIDMYVSGNFGNAGGLIGQGCGTITLNNVVVHAEKEDGSNIATSFYTDLGSRRTEVPTVWTETNVIYLSYTSGNLRQGSLLLRDTTAINSVIVADLLAASNGLFSFNVTTEVLSFSINGNTYDVSKAPGTKLATPVLSKTGQAVTWEAVPGARGYQVIINDGSPIATTNTSYNIESLPVGDHEFVVIAIGNNYDVLNSDPSEKLVVTIEPVVLDPIAETVVSLDGTNVSWTAVGGAVGYQVYINGTAYGDVTTSLGLDLSAFTFGEYVIHVVVKADYVSFIDSDLSNVVTYAKKHAVTTATELKDAINSNIGYIDVSNDIDLTGYTVASSSTFTGLIDGNNNKLSNLTITSGSAALIKTIGNGATFRNMTIKDSTITAGESNMAVLASTITAGAKVKVINVAFVNIMAQTLVNNSSSTQGGVFGTYRSTTDNNINVLLDRVYVDYSHNVVRTDKAQSNIGAVFGAFEAGSQEALTIKNSYIKFHVAGYWSNAGALVGNNMTISGLTNTVIEANYSNKHASSSAVNFDSGNTTRVITSSHVILLSDSVNVGIRATLTDAITRTSANLTIDDLNTLMINDSSVWTIDPLLGTATLHVAGADYIINITVA